MIFQERAFGKRVVVAGCEAPGVAVSVREVRKMKVRTWQT